MKYGWTYLNFFNRCDQPKKLFEKYKFHPLLCVKMKLKINCKLEFHATYTMIEFFMEIQAQNGNRDDHNEEFSLSEPMIEPKPSYFIT